MSAQRLPKRNFFLLTWNRASKDENLVGQPVLKKTAQDWARLYVDYLEGAAQAINPLPLTNLTVYHHSDAEALHSDWQFVRSDLDAVWTTHLRRLLEHISNDERGRSEADDPAESGGQSDSIDTATK
jgi:hypothetical protein